MLNFLSRSNWLRWEKKRFICLFWNDYLEISPLFQSAIILIPKEFQFCFSFHPRNFIFRKIVRRFSSLRYILFVVCENPSLFFRIAGEGWDLHLLYSLRFSSSRRGKIYQFCHVQSDNEGKARKTRENRRVKINVTISAWRKEEANFFRCGNNMDPNMGKMLRRWK